MSVKIVVLTLLALGANYIVSSEKVVMCYWGTWATYRGGLGRFDVETINPDLCSHIVYSFVGINNQGTVISLDPFLDLPDNWGRDYFGKLNTLKQKSPRLKTLLAVGGWNEGSGKYSVMAGDPNLRKNFITSALNFVQTYGFDGFDLDWEYPARRDTVLGSADINNFSILVKEMKEEFNKYGLLLTAAVSSVGEMAALSYDIAEISKHLDFIGLMTYDLYGAWDAVTGHNAPLHKGEGDENAVREKLYTVDVAVEYWLEKGCPPEKLILGVPFYGRTFTLTNANVNGVRAPASGAGIAGPFTVTAGSVGYNEFCDIMRTESGWNVRQDSLAKVPYAVKDRNWVSYDDPNSIAEKVNYALEKKLGGVMLWSIETDDFQGLCNGEDYPLLRTINRVLGRSVDGSDVVTTTTAATTTTVAATTTEAVTTTTAAPTTTEAVTTTTAAPTTTQAVTTTAAAATAAAATTEAATNVAATTSTPSGSVCTEEGPTPNPDDCGGFLMCTRAANGDFIPVVFSCPTGLQYDAVNQYCNYANLVNCV